MELDLHGSHSRAFKEIVLEENATLVSSIKTKMASASHFGRICKVLEKFKKEYEEKYLPQVVSIGPFHRGKERLKVVEEHKWKYLNTLLSRTINVEIRLGKCVEVLKMLEDRARKCYGEEIHMKSDEFVEMMLVDGCFIIELFHKSCCKGIRRRGDPFLATYQVLFQLRRDLILLENQIPFFVLQHLFHIVPIPKQCGEYSLVELAFRFFKRMVPEDPLNLRGNYGQEIHHLLDLIHQSYIPKAHILQQHSQQEPHTQMNLPTATQLLKTGTELKKTSSRSVLEVKFNNGTLRIPTFKHHDLVEILLSNLVAMEGCCYDATKYVTSYVFLMKSLIQSNEDEQILYKNGVIDRKEEYWVTLLSKLLVDLDPKDFYYGDLCEKVNNFAKVNKSIWYARKVRNCVSLCLREL